MNSPRHVASASSERARWPARDPIPAVAHAVDGAAPDDLDACLVADRMRDELQAVLPGFADGRWTIDALTVRGARRNASRTRNPVRLAVVYELSARERAGGRRERLVLHGRVYRPGADEDCWREHQGRSWVPVPVGEPMVRHAARAMVLWALPNDPGLAALAELLDPARARQRLGDLSGHAPTGPAWAVTLVRHEPGDRACLRYAAADARANPSEAVYAKVFADARARAVHQRFAHAWASASRDADAPRVARPLVWCADTGSVWFEAARGTPLLQALPGAGGASTLARVGRALARLHGWPLELAAGAEVRDAAHWLREVGRRHRKIARVAPGTRGALDELVARLASRADEVRGRALCLVHGDFHHDQVWIDDGRPVFFDLDECTLGDPMEDLASFTVKLGLLGVHDSLLAAVVQGYARAAGERFDRRALAWHGQVQGLLQAARAFGFQRPGWRADLERRLALALREDLPEWA